MDGMRLRFLLITLSSLLIFGACSSDTYDFIITSSDPDAVNIENIVTPNDSSEYPHLTQTTDEEEKFSPGEFKVFTMLNWVVSRRTSFLSSIYKKFESEFPH